MTWAPDNSGRSEPLTIKETASYGEAEEGWDEDMLFDPSTGNETASNGESMTDWDPNKFCEVVIT